MHALGGDRADHGAERERRQHRREREDGVDPALLTGSPGSRTQGVGAPAHDDPDAGDEERDRERRRDRAEGGRVGGPDDGEDEDQPDVVGLPDGRHRMMGLVANLVGLLASARDELPEAGAEGGAAEHGVEREPHEREPEWYLVEMHQTGVLERRSRTQATPAASAR